MICAFRGRRLAGVLSVAGALIGASAGPAPALDIDQWAGLYRFRHRIENAATQRVREVENVLEVVKHSPTTAYIRFRLHFTNGHTCSAFGIAEAEEDALTYRAFGPETAGRICVIRLESKDGVIAMSDPDGADGPCRILYCGANGTIAGATFPKDSRREIRQTDRILRSWQYKEALGEYERLLQNRAAASSEQP